MGAEQYNAGLLIAEEILPAKGGHGIFNSRLEFRHIASRFFAIPNGWKGEIGTGSAPNPQIRARDVAQRW
jgi:hypothetical protein